MAWLVYHYFPLYIILGVIMHVKLASVDKASRRGVFQGRATALNTVFIVHPHEQKSNYIESELLEKYK